MGLAGFADTLAHPPKSNPGVILEVEAELLIFERFPTRICYGLDASGPGFSTPSRLQAKLNPHAFLGDARVVNL